MIKCVIVFSQPVSARKANNKNNNLQILNELFRFRRESFI